jgi:sterol desaturase/sphingolipid hydroxylase (fatty acid hydroxylase superfamily)
MELLTTHETTVRMACFAAVLVAMAAWELAAPRRPRVFSRRLRWTGNFGVLALDTLLVRLTFPILAVGLALIAEDRSWGLLNLAAAPFWLAFTVSLLALDLAVYAQHRMFHGIPTLWRLHRMHHADLEFDVTTGLRFHPIEIVLSMAIKLAVVAALGAPAAAVLIFEVLLNATAMFNHGNVRMWPAIDRLLRWVVVTPDMHRVHHSLHAGETNSNFGFNLPWWDRLFGTYRAQPVDGHEQMHIGLAQFRTRHDLRLDRMLIQPWLPLVERVAQMPRRAAPTTAHGGKQDARLTSSRSRRAAGRGQGEVSGGCDGTRPTAPFPHRTAPGQTPRL